MFRNKDVSFLKSDALKLSWYEYFLLDMILMVVGILTLSLLIKSDGIVALARRVAGVAASLAFQC